MKNQEICGFCTHHHKENDEWICENPDSECYGCYTEYNDDCDSFESRYFSVEIKNKKSKNISKFL